MCLVPVLWAAEGHTRWPLPDGHKKHEHSHSKLQHASGFLSEIKDCSVRPCAAGVAGGGTARGRGGGGPGGGGGGGRADIVTARNGLPGTDRFSGSRQMLSKLRRIAKGFQSMWDLSSATFTCCELYYCSVWSHNTSFRTIKEAMFAQESIRRIARGAGRTAYRAKIHTSLWRSNYRLLARERWVQQRAQRTTR